MTKVLNFRVIVNQDEDGVFVASCPSLPGCHSQGRTYEKALENVEDAINLCLKVAEEDLSYLKRVQKKFKPQFVGVVDVPVRVKIPALL